MAKFCSECGHKLEEDEVFCSECGTKVAGPAEVNLPTMVTIESESSTTYGANNGGASSDGGFLASLSPQVKKKAIWAVVALVFFVGVALVRGGDDSVATSSSAVVNVKAAEMIDDYIRDQGTAETKYKGKTVSITGKIQRKSQFNNSNNFVLVLEEKFAAGKSYQVSLDVPADKVSIVNNAEVGKYVNVTGKCVGIVKQEDPTDVSVQIKAENINQ